MQEGLGELVWELYCGIVAVSGYDVICDIWEEPRDSPDVRKYDVREFPDELQNNLKHRTKLILRIYEKGRTFKLTSNLVTDERYKLWKKHPELSQYLPK